MNKQIIPLLTLIVLIGYGPEIRAEEAPATTNAPAAEGAEAGVVKTHPTPATTTAPAASPASAPATSPASAPATSPASVPAASPASAPSPKPSTSLEIAEKLKKLKKLLLIKENLIKELKEISAVDQSKKGAMELKVAFEKFKTLHKKLIEIVASIQKMQQEIKSNPVLAKTMVFQTVKINKALKELNAAVSKAKEWESNLSRYLTTVTPLPKETPPATPSAATSDTKTAAESSVTEDKTAAAGTTPAEGATVYDPTIGEESGAEFTEDDPDIGRDPTDIELDTEPAGNESDEGTSPSSYYGDPEDATETASNETTASSDTSDTTATTTTDSANVEESDSASGVISSGQAEDVPVVARAPLERPISATTPSTTSSNFEPAMTPIKRPKRPVADKTPTVAVAPKPTTPISDPIKVPIKIPIKSPLSPKIAPISEPILAPTIKRELSEPVISAISKDISKDSIIETVDTTFRTAVIKELDQMKVVDNADTFLAKLKKGDETISVTNLLTALSEKIEIPAENIEVYAQNTFEKPTNYDLAAFYLTLLNKTDSNEVYTLDPQIILKDSVKRLNRMQEKPEDESKPFVAIPFKLLSILKVQCSNELIIQEISDNLDLAALYQERFPETGDIDWATLVFRFAYENQAMVKEKTNTILQEGIDPQDKIYALTNSFILSLQVNEQPLIQEAKGDNIQPIVNKGSFATAFTEAQVCAIE